MKTLFDEDDALRAQFPGGEDDDLESGADTGSAGAGDELDSEDDEYIDVDEGEDEALDEEDAINSDDAAGEAEETATDEEGIDDDDTLNENEDLEAEGADMTRRGYAQKSALDGPANDLVAQP